jgi:hypothetical protein
LITVKDITKQLNFPNAARDATGRLRVGAAVGVGRMGAAGPHSPQVRMLPT